MIKIHNSIYTNVDNILRYRNLVISVFLFFLKTASVNANVMSHQKRHRTNISLFVILFKKYDILSSNIVPIVSESLSLFFLSNLNVPRFSWPLCRGTKPMHALRVARKTKRRIWYEPYVLTDDF